MFASRATRTQVEAQAIVFSMGVSVMSVLVLAGLVLFGGLRFTSTVDFGTVTASSLAGVTVLSFIAGYWWQRPVSKKLLHRFKFYVHMVFLSVSHGAIAFLLAAAITAIASHYAPQIVVNALFMAVVLSFILSVAAYSMYSQAAFMSASKLTGIFMVFLAAGALASMLTSQNTQWLERHFSALGAGGDLSSYTFNLTMVVGGFLIIALSDYIVVELEHIRKQQLTDKAIRMWLLRILFLLIGFGMIGLGVFPYDKFLLIHNLFANTSTIAFMLLLMTIPWTVPMFSRPFLLQSYVVVSIGIVVYAQFFIGNLNIFIIELIDSLLLFSWMILFVRQIAAILNDQQLILRKELYSSDNNVKRGIHEPTK